MISDKVFTVNEAAFRGLQGLGEKVYLKKKPKGKLIKDINKKLQKVGNSFEDSEFTFLEFKTKFKSMYPEEYDTYEGEKKNKFEQWLKNSISSLPKK